MKKYSVVVVFLMLFGLVMLAQPLVLAGAPPAMATPLSLAISQIKITGDEFVVLQNNGGQDIPDLSSYWLGEFNSYNPLDSGVSSSSQQLPSVKLGSGQTVLLSSVGMATCGAVATGKLSVSLGDSAGFLQIVQTSLNSLGVTQTPVDSVSWAATANGQIQGVPSSSKDPKGMYYRYVNGGAYKWQLADLDVTIPCQLDVFTGGNVSSGLAPANGTVPSVVGVSGGAAGGGLPADDIGLSAPQLSEILPNPAAPQTDTNDEFVELYNSNTKPFDLSGFMIQVGISTTHKYTFPDGTTLQPQQFGVYYSSDTGLSLSNTTGQVELLDPSGNVLEQSDIYATAKDSYAWVFADGLWQWTTTTTPGAKNIITAPPASKSSSNKSSSSKTAVLGAAKTGGSGSNSSGSGASNTTTASSLHPAILAGVGALAVLYALYEYRHDLAGALYRFRRYRAARGESGQTAQNTGGLRTAL
jgi:hypothetical protein